MFSLAQHLAKAKYLPDLAPDVAYSVQPRLFYGSFNKARPNDMREQSVDLYLPPFVQKWQVLSLDVERREKELLRYYTSVLQAARQHRQDLRHLNAYFGLQPVLRSKSRTLVSFPWPDTYPRAAGFLRAMQSDKTTDTLYDEADQGWQFEAYAVANKLYLADGSDDDDRPAVVYYTDRDHFAQLAASALTRIQQQLALFVRETGQNPWQYGNQELGKPA
ncbi:MAG: hypothetical protein ACRYFX_23010 [Janthinobacterium lividum]